MDKSVLSLEERLANMERVNTALNDGVRDALERHARNGETVVADIGNGVEEIPAIVALAHHLAQRAKADDSAAPPPDMALLAQALAQVEYSAEEAPAHDLMERLLARVLAERIRLGA